MEEEIRVMRLSRFHRRPQRCSQLAYELQQEHGLSREEALYIVWEAQQRAAIRDRNHRMQRAREAAERTVTAEAEFNREAAEAAEATEARFDRQVAIDLSDESLSAMLAIWARRFGR
jgi:uncharacterized membrane protein YqiK